MKLEKKDNVYASNPNIAAPEIYLYEKNLTLRFPVNTFINNLEDGHIGKILFKNCTAFRVGSPNDEGYGIGSDTVWNEASFPGIEWHHFYEVLDSSGPTFERFFTTESHDQSSQRHFVFFMKEATFECYARDFENLS